MTGESEVQTKTRYPSSPPFSFRTGPGVTPISLVGPGSRPDEDRGPRCRGVGGENVSRPLCLQWLSFISREGSG